MKKKREIFSFSLLEFKEIEKRLEKRAAEGWRLKKTGFFWTYEKAEPKQVRYSIVFFPKTDALQPEPSDSLVMMREYCEKTGWKLVAEQGQMQIFCNEEKNPIPIETEAWIQVKNIHETMKKGNVLAHVILLVNAVVQLGLQAMQFFVNPLDWLCMGFNFYMIWCWVALGTGSAIEIIHYYTWYKKAKRVAEEEEILYLPKSIMGLRITCLSIAMVALVLAIFAITNFMTVKYGLFVIFWTAVLVGVPIGVSKFLKKWKVSARWNRVIIILLAILCSVGMVVGLIFSISRDSDIIMGRDDDFLLHISDFREVDEEELRDHSRKSDSVFLFLEEGYQNEDWEEGEDIRARIHMDYTFIMVKLPFVYDFCKAELIEEKTQYVDVAFEDQSGYRKVDMPIWEAEEVYQYYNYDGKPENEYLVCYSDRILRIDIGWEVTDEDIVKIREAIYNAK